MLTKYQVFDLLVFIVVAIAVSEMLKQPSEPLPRLKAAMIMLWALNGVFGCSMVVLSVTSRLFTQDLVVRDETTSIGIALNITLLAAVWMTHRRVVHECLDAIVRAFRRPVSGSQCSR